MNEDNVSLSDQVAQRIRSAQRTTKSEKAFKNIVEACDFLVAQEIEITASAVGSITAGKHGGPKTQSIRNNADFRTYIKARRGEQGGLTTRDSVRKQHIRTGDNAIDAYIQTIEAELRQAKAEVRDLRRAIPSLGNFDLKSALEQGILTVSAPVDTGVSRAVIDAINTMLNPARLASVGLELVTTGQIISHDHLQQVLLKKQQVDALRTLE